MTAEGKKLLKIAEPLLQEWNHTELEMKMLFKLQKGCVQIAAMPSFALAALPSLIASFSKRYTDISFSIEDIASEKAIACVINGKTELAVGFDVDFAHDLIQEPLMDDHPMLVVSSQHQLSTKQTITFEEIGCYDIVALKAPSFYHKALSSSTELTIKAEAHNLVTLIELIKHGVGISVLPEILAEQAIADGLHCIPITDINTNRTIYIYHKGLTSLSSASRQFLQHMKTTCTLQRE